MTECVLEFDRVAIHLGGRDITISSSTLSGNGGVALSAFRVLTVHDVVIHGLPTANGAHGGVRLTGDGLTVDSGYACGSSFHTVNLKNVSCTGTVGFGLQGRSLSLTDSTVTSAGSSDVVSRQSPVLVNTTCNHSSDFNGDSWHLCSLDP